MPGVLAEDATFERLWLDEQSWVDIARGWILEPDELYADLVEQAPWQQGRVFRYERWVDEPRLGAWYAVGRTGTPEVITEAHRVLQRRYNVRFDGVALAWYRDARDSVAFHRDRELRWLDDTVIGVVTLGARRPWVLRPRANRYDHEAPNRGATHDLAPASGDLFVMGGATQARWEHAVPKVRGAVGGRVSLQWRWTAKRGRPERGANYSAPRLYSR